MTDNPTEDPIEAAVDPMPPRSSPAYLGWMKRRVLEILETNDFDAIQRMFAAAHGEAHHHDA